jgi:hypothetical protein
VRFCLAAGLFCKPDHVGDPTRGQIFTAVTGIAEDVLERCAEILVTQQRAILIRKEGLSQDDFPPESLPNL